jgi:hypothetical protein
MIGTSSPDAGDAQEAKPLLGLVLSVVVAAVVGWLSVPNSMVPSDSRAAHGSMALALAGAASVWGWVFARGVATEPGYASIRLALATYATAFPAAILCGVPIAPFFTWTGPGVVGLDGFFLAVVPWLVIVSVLWGACMSLMVGDPPRIVRVAERNATGRGALAILAVALAVAVAVGCLNLPDVRHIGWEVPASPAPHRPEVVGVVLNAAYSGQGETYSIELQDGRAFSVQLKAGLDPWIGSTGDLFVGSANPNGWYSFLGRRSSAEWSIGDVAYAWDRGDSILLPDGLELRKAAHASVNVTPQPAFSESVYVLSCSYISVNDQAEIETLAGGCV